MPEPTMTKSLAGLSRRLLRTLASVRLTLGGFLLLGVAVLAASRGWPGGHWPVTAVLSLLALNLAAALLVNPAFRALPALFGFHFGLLMLVLCLGVGQLTRFKGHLELAEGQDFDPAVVVTDRRAWLEPSLPREGAFRQGAINVNYAAGLVRRDSLSTVTLDDGRELHAGDGHPLVVDGHRFYLTHNKGFSALLRWEGRDKRQTRRGVVNFPSYPRLAPQQERQWRTPGGTQLTLLLQPSPYPQDANWRLDRGRAGGSLWVEVPGNGSMELVVGDYLDLPAGRLHLEGLGMWMGYRVYHDPSLPWLLVSALISMGFLAYHVHGRLAAPRGRIPADGSRIPGVAP
jgi:hypothetical protein